MQIGVARSGTKVSSKYKMLKASTNDAFCPTLREQTKSYVLDQTSAALELVIDGLTPESAHRAVCAKSPVTIREEN